MIRAIIEIELPYPYKKSISVLVDFCTVWGSTILSGGTNRAKAFISMPSNRFKEIFGHNPIVGEYSVPSGAKSFMESLKVKEVMVE